MKNDTIQVTTSDVLDALFSDDIGVVEQAEARLMEQIMYQLERQAADVPRCGQTNYAPSHSPSAAAQHSGACGRAFIFRVMQLN